MWSPSGIQNSEKGPIVTNGGPAKGSSSAEEDNRPKDCSAGGQPSKELSARGQPSQGRRGWTTVRRSGQPTAEGRRDDRHISNGDSCQGQSFQGQRGQPSQGQGQPCQRQPCQRQPRSRTTVSRSEWNNGRNKFACIRLRNAGVWHVSTGNLPNSRRTVSNEAPLEFRHVSNGRTTEELPKVNYGTFGGQRTKNRRRSTMEQFGPTKGQRRNIWRSTDEGPPNDADGRNDEDDARRRITTEQR